MTIHFPPDLSEALERLAAAQGQELESVIERALREYVEAAAITDLSSADIGEAQMAMLPELKGIIGDDEHWQSNSDETR